MIHSAGPQPKKYSGCGLVASAATFISFFTAFLSAVVASATMEDTDQHDTPATGQGETSHNLSKAVKVVVVRSVSALADTLSSPNNASIWDVPPQSHINDSFLNDETGHYMPQCANLTAAEAVNFSQFCMPPLPKYLFFSDDNAVSVITYSCLFVVAACGNLTVFITLYRNRGSKSRINMFIMHLAIADLIVTFIILPLEIAWHATVAWKAGDIACRGLMFFRAMGFYLSSCIVVSISLDRYFAIMRPFSIAAADTRAKMMLVLSWALSIVASIPQSVIFHVEKHPTYTWFEQCVTFNFFPSPEHELAYNLFSIIALYGLPLAIITFAYCVILCRISKKSRQSKGEVSGRVYDDGSCDQARLRRSGIGNIERAKSRTLKMTCVIVGAYVMCWTPYFVISTWYYFDRESAMKVDAKVQRGLFIFAVSNSCINPIVYGMFTIKFKRELIRCCYCLQGAIRRRRQDDSCGLRRSLLVPWKRNSESSTSSRNERLVVGRAAQLCGTTSGAGAGDVMSLQIAVPQGCRYSFVSPLADVKASSSRASLSSLGREERLNLVGYTRAEDRVSFGTGCMLGVPGVTVDRSALTNGYMSSREDRANLNNFVRLGSVE